MVSVEAPPLMCAVVRPAASGNRSQVVAAPIDMSSELTRRLDRSRRASVAPVCMVSAVIGTFGLKCEAHLSAHPSVRRRRARSLAAPSRAALILELPNAARWRPCSAAGAPVAAVLERSCWPAVGGLVAAIGPTVNWPAPKRTVTAACVAPLQVGRGRSS